MNELVFDPQTHTYTLDGKTLVSVTQLLHKHGLSPNYEGVDEKTLTNASEHGKLVHEEIEAFIKRGERGCFTNELDAFKQWLVDNEDVEVLASEEEVHNDVVAGRYDLLLAVNGEKVIADIKTTSTLHADSVSWQLSLYSYLLGGDVKSGLALHFAKNGLRVVPIPLKPRTEVEKLLECERKGEIYKQELIVEGYELAQLYEAEQIIIKAKEEQKRAEETQKEVYNAILKAMEEQGVKTYETDTMKITYVAPAKRVTLDTARLRKENPLVAKAYEKESEIKASLRITLKGD